jgi:hypothetical protein
MHHDWDLLSDELELTISREALRCAAQTVALQAEMLANEMQAGGLTDRGGSNALLLIAAVVRAIGRGELDRPVRHGAQAKERTH